MTIRSFLPLVLLAACAPAARPVAITPEMVEHAPRFRLVYDPVVSTTLDAKVIDKVGVQLEEGLAQRGLIAAAPWETPTYEIHYSLQGGTTDEFSVVNTGGPTVTYAQVSYTGCSGPNWSADHCGAADGIVQPVAVTYGRMVPSATRRIAVAVVDVASGKVKDTESRSEHGTWTPATVGQGRSLVRNTVGALEF